MTDIKASDLEDLQSSIYLLEGQRLSYEDAIKFLQGRYGQSVEWWNDFLLWKLRETPGTTSVG